MLIIRSFLNIESDGKYYYITKLLIIKFFN